MRNRPPVRDGLGRLAERINARHRQVTEEALAGAREVGELLLQAKQHVGHGKFMDWVSKHCRFNQRTAERYMEVAEHWDLLDREAVSINAALAFLRNSTRVSNLDAAFPPLPPDEEAEYLETVQTHAAAASAERQARAADKAERKSQIRCPACGHHFNR